MPQLKRMLRGAGKAPISEAAEAARRRRRTIFITAVVFIILALIAAIVSVSYYFSEDARYNRLTVINVDDTSIKMDYFLKRIQLSGSGALEMIGVLTQEQVIKIEAPRYVGEVTPNDIDQKLKGIVSGEGETLSEVEFNEWYRQLLNEIDFSDSEYREMVAAAILTERLQEYLGERMPTVAEQVYLYGAVLSAEEVEKIQEKEDVEGFIGEIWQEKQAGAEIQDIGWVPPGILPSGFDEVVFSLPVGKISAPVSYMSDDPSYDYEIFYYLLMVSERADARQIGEDYLETLKVVALDDWLEEEVKAHDVVWRGLNNGFDSETNAWISYQLSKVEDG
ncbi:hypothetical protein ACFLYC_01505 [Chloroflexota bacterium]